MYIITQEVRQVMKKHINSKRKEKVSTISLLLSEVLQQCTSNQQSS